MFKMLKRLGKIVIVIVSLLAIIGFGFEQVTERQVLTKYPAPGTLVQLEGYSLHFNISGQPTNKPTIILEAGQGGFSTSWVRIQELLSQETQVVSYDRAGYGWSDSDNQPANLIRNSQELHLALAELDIAPPYILVGHSLGGLYASIFADQYAEDVVGLILVDPSPPRLFENLPEDMLARQASVTSMMQSMELASYFGVLRIMNPLTAFMGDMPEEERNATIALSSHPGFISTYLEENEIVMALPDSFSLQHELIDMPLIVLSSNQAPDGQTMPEGIIETTQQLHQEWANQSSHGQWLVIDGSNHFSIILKEDHARQVVDIIRDMLELN